MSADMKELIGYEIPADEQPKPRPAPKRYAGARQRSRCRKANNAGRTLRFTPATSARLARLVIKTVWNGRVEASEYVVHETGSQIGRGFLLAKVGEDGPVYESHVGGQGLFSCTCSGFEFGFSCRHVEALAKVIELGLIPGGTP
jgi:hypothetical protein